MAFNKDPNFWLSVGSGLLSGGTAQQQMANMGQNIAQYNMTADQKAQAAAEKAKADAAQNKTLQYLMQNDPEIGAAMQAGLPAPDALKMYMAKREKAQAPKSWKDNYMEVGGALVGPGQDGKIAPVYTPGPKPEDLAKQKADNFNAELDLNKMYRGEDPVKSYEGVKAGFEKIRSATTLESGAGDLGIVFGYMKMLDPQSVVREGEAASVQQVGGAAQQLVGLYNNIIGGQKLTPEVRNQILTAAQKLYHESASNLDDRNKYYNGLADRGSVDHGFIMNPEQFPPLEVGGQSVPVTDGNGATIGTIRRTK